MSENPKGGRSLADLRAEIDTIDASIHDAVIRRAAAEASLRAAQNGRADPVSTYSPERDAEVMRQLVERHHGDLSLTAMEHLWRQISAFQTDAKIRPTIYLDGNAEPMEMLDLARFYFGFSVDLLVGNDASDVVGIVSETDCDLGLIGLTDRADLPWWRGLSDQGAQVCARLPFVILDERPADLPALVLARSGSLVDNVDIAVYDARWSDILPGRLMDQGMEVLSFFRSASGVDALLAVSADLSEEEVLKTCSDAGAAPTVLRRVGGYAAPIDGDSDLDDDFDSGDEGSQE